MRPSRSLALIGLPLIYLWMVSSLAAATADCVDCITTDGATGAQITLANATSLTSTIRQIDERATAIGCNFIKTNRNFSQLETGLQLAGYTPEEFFHNGTCELTVTSTHRDELRPLKFAIADPSSNRAMVETFLRHLDGLGDRELVKDILNHTDNGMTTLDYLDYLYHEGFSRNQSAQRNLDALRREFCRRGGEYRSRNASCSTSA